MMNTLWQLERHSPASTGILGPRLRPARELPVSACSWSLNSTSTFRSLLSYWNILMGQCLTVRWISSHNWVPSPQLPFSPRQSRAVRVEVIASSSCQKFANEQTLSIWSSQSGVSLAWLYYTGSSCIKESALSRQMILFSQCCEGWGSKTCGLWFCIVLWPEFLFET